MKRLHLVEIVDQDWCPRAVRHGLTDFLQLAFTNTRAYAAMVPVLAAALRRSGERRIVDLCSGASGPWMWLQPALAKVGLTVSVCLTDKYPNLEAFTKARQSTLNGIRYYPQPVDATEVSSELQGFRTIFTAFHHFTPERGRAVLADAVLKHQGIALFEINARRPLPFLFTLLAPLLVLLCTPFIRPFRLSRLFWTYLFPMIPLVAMFDGLVSCLRAYSVKELRELSCDLATGDYCWESGTIKAVSAQVPVTYLIGIPAVVAPAKASAGENAPAQAAILAHFDSRA